MSDVPNSRFEMPDDSVLAMLGKITIAHEYLKHHLLVNLAYLKSPELFMTDMNQLYKKYGDGTFNDIAKELAKTARLKLKDNAVRNMLISYVDRAVEIDVKRDELVRALWASQSHSECAVKDKKTHVQDAPTLHELRAFFGEYMQLFPKFYELRRGDGLAAHLKDK